MNVPELLQIRSPQAEFEDGAIAPVIEISPDFREFTEARSVEQIVKLGQEILADPTFPTVRAWRAAGGKAVGCFPVYTPQELVHSLGLFPVALQGGGRTSESPGRMRRWVPSSARSPSRLSRWR